ncbi:MAG: hypothetical protein QHH13_08370 [Melioribacter sp.]|uniref:hypothetical protein n=1 Tax=Rosettibacter primus TaxID=3111523 RepID=UPI00247C6FE5|nr:hypothetical protein [Melioribacter sp.]
MKKLLIIIFSLIFISHINYLGQSLYSVQVGGGLLIPNNADRGLSGNIQLNYKLSEKRSLYFHTGILLWDKNIISIATGYGKPYSSYSESDHVLYPFYFGVNWNLKSINAFHIYLNSELGYNYLKYYGYKNVIMLDEENKKVISFYADQASKKYMSKSLFGAGIGVGIKNMMSSNLGLSIEMKLNTLFYTVDNPKTYYTLSGNFIFGL